MHSPAHLEHYLQDFEVLEDVLVPGHKAIRITYPQRPVQHTVQVARPSLVVQSQPQLHPEFAEQIQAEWLTTNQDEYTTQQLLDWWATKWE